MLCSVSLDMIEDQPKLSSSEVQRAPCLDFELASELVSAREWWRCHLKDGIGRRDRPPPRSHPLWQCQQLSTGQYQSRHRAHIAPGRCT